MYRSSMANHIPHVIEEVMKDVPEYLYEGKVSEFHPCTPAIALQLASEAVELWFLSVNIINYFLYVLGPCLY